MRNNINPLTQRYEKPDDKLEIFTYQYIHTTLQCFCILSSYQGMGQLYKDYLLLKNKEKGFCSRRFFISVCWRQQGRRKHLLVGGFIQFEGTFLIRGVWAKKIL